MHHILFEDHSHFDLLPFCWTRPIYELRSGIFTMKERWEKELGENVFSLAYDYLNPHFGSNPPQGDAIWVNGKAIPDTEILRMIKDLAPNSYMGSASEVWLARFSSDKFPAEHDGLIDLDLVEKMGLQKVNQDWNGKAIRHCVDLFQMAAFLIQNDIKILQRTQTFFSIKDPHTRIYGADNIFAEEGVKVRAAIINAEDGPIYFGKNVQVGEGSIIRSTHAFGRDSKLSLGSKFRGDSSFGPRVKVGGEVANSVIMGYSNKAHDGYLGNSVLGYFCNLGADCNTSNLKNNYAEVKLWNYVKKRFTLTDTINCGLMMGDHSKAGINVMFNTGTVIGVGANIYGAGYPRNFIPSFSWGGPGGYTTYRLDKMMEVARIVMARRDLDLGETEADILAKVFELTEGMR